MKIAIISSNTLPTPVGNMVIPKGWTSSIHEVVSTIAEGMVEKGHDVTLFASGDSKTSAKLESLWSDCSYKLENHVTQFSYSAYDDILTAYCFEKNKTEKYDIIYAYNTFDSGFFGNLIETPIVSTYHGAGQFDFEKIWPQKIIKPNIYVAISEFQKSSCSFINFSDVIYNGVDKNLFAFKEKNTDDNLIFVGRISTDKGTDIAAQVCGELNIRLDIVGSTDSEELITKIKSNGERINLMGQKPHNEVKELVANSKAFIFPTRWNEPFGLVLTESLASGTPVVAFANGSLPEIIEDGKTGFLVNMDEEDINGDWIIKQIGIEGLKKAINKIYAMNEDEYKQMRKNCRESFEEKFTKDKMVDNYEKLFLNIVDKNLQ